MTRIFALIIIVIAAVTVGSPLVAQTDTVFTYQGELNENGGVANGSFDFEFVLWDALAGGNQVGTPNVLNDVQVFDGRFTVELDFGASAFNNTSRWIGVSVNGSELSPRQPVTRAPYSIQTRGIFVDANNNVGIGTSTPIYPLHVESDGDNSIVSESRSTSGRGLLGWASATTGDAFGVYGLSSSTSGRGVYGRADASTGSTYGGYFWSLSTSGRGVYGQAAASTGSTYGVYGESLSTSGRGVYGEANASTGITDGVFGRSNSTSGRGICGWAPASSGTTYGVVGQSDSTSGTGVRGYAAATSGNTTGVYGKSDSFFGRGVVGEAIHPTGPTRGGYFESRSDGGIGVLGVASASTGPAIGVFGESHRATGSGVRGTAFANSGSNFGVVGRSNSPDGFDFYASGAGENYGSNSSIRWKHNVEPISNPLRKLAQLRGVYFDWDEEHGGHHDLGMIAEEVGEVLPEIVQYEENGIDAIGMDYSKMTPLLVEAVNALHSEITSLRAEKNSEINSLRAEKDAEIAALKSNAMELTADNNRLAARLGALEQAVQRLAPNEK